MGSASRGVMSRLAAPALKTASAAGHWVARNRPSPKANQIARSRQEFMNAIVTPRQFGRQAKTRTERSQEAEFQSKIRSGSRRRPISSLAARLSSFAPFGRTGLASRQFV